MNPQLAAATQLTMAMAVAAEEHRDQRVYSDVLLVAADLVDQLFAEGREVAVVALFRVFDVAVGRAAHEAGVSRPEMAREIVQVIATLHGDD